jgi:hypothetical protein
MQNDDGTFTVNYKGEWITYEFLYELCDFVMEVDELDWDEDENKIWRIASRIDMKAAISPGPPPSKEEIWGNILDNQAEER